MKNALSFLVFAVGVLVPCRAGTSLARARRHMGKNDVQAKTTPATQVIEMLTDMKAKGEESMKAEAATYKEYKAWVWENQKDLGFEMQTHNSNIEKLSADIAKSKSEVAKYGAAVEELNTQIANLESEKAGAIKMSNAAHAEYLKVSQDLSESVDALERAIAELKAQAYDRPQAEAFLQHMAKETPGMRRVLAAFLQQGSRSADDDDGSGAPEVAGYAFQSGGIVETLEKLLDQFKEELSETEKAEANRDHQYNLEILHLEKDLEISNRDVQARTAAKGQSAAAAASSNGELQATQADLAAADELSKSIAATFEQKTTTFNMNQEVRAQELDALTKAIDILSSGAVSESYATHVKTAVSFLQKGSASRSVTRQRVFNLLHRRGQQLSSQELEKMAQQVAENPLAKVIGMIEDLLEKLQEEAAAEADHKQWCDNELARNKATREATTAKVGELNAEIAGLNASINEMAAEIATLETESAELAKAMEEATAQRGTEKETNLKTIADAEAGAEAVKQALVILHEFYSSQGEQAELLQKSQKAKQVPELEPYKGMQEKNTGVIGMLEVIETDFARLSSETRTAEDQAAKDYKSFMSESTTEMKRKHDAVFKLTLDKDQAEFEKDQTQKELEATSAKLDAANDYYQTLEPACVTIHVSFEERQEKRQQEIEALKEAYDILDQKGS